MACQPLITLLCVGEDQHQHCMSSNLIFCFYFAPRRFQWHCSYLIFKLTLVIVGWGIFYEIPLRCMSLDLTDDKSTLVEVMAWCRQATSHYLSQCWTRSMSPYGSLGHNKLTHKQWETRMCQTANCGYWCLDVNASGLQYSQCGTRTTRTPAFWGYPRRLMITHSIESYWIPSQMKTKSKLQI